MEITEQALDKFIALWEATSTKRITRDEAHEYARQLLQLVNSVYGPY